MPPYHPGVKEAKPEDERILESYARLAEEEAPAPAEPGALSSQTIGEPVAIGTGGEVPGESPAPAVSAARREVELPDFLLGADGAPSGEPTGSSSPETIQATEAIGAVNLEETARELEDLAAERIQALAEELRGQPTDVCIRHAFAAGYLAGKAERKE